MRDGRVVSNRFCSSSISAHLPHVHIRGELHSEVSGAEDFCGKMELCLVLLLILPETRNWTSGLE